MGNRKNHMKIEGKTIIIHFQHSAIAHLIWIDNFARNARLLESSWKKRDFSFEFFFLVFHLDFAIDSIDKIETLFVQKMKRKEIWKFATVQRSVRQRCEKKKKWRNGNNLSPSEWIVVRNFFAWKHAILINISGSSDSIFVPLLQSLAGNCV